MTDDHRYFLRRGGQPWQAVSRRTWVQAERGAGFHPKVAPSDPRYHDTPATGGFSTSAGGGLAGRVVDLRHYTPERYAFDPSFPVLTETARD